MGKRKVARGVAVIVAVLALLALPLGPATAAPDAGVEFVDAAGISVLSHEQVGPRTFDVTMTSAAIGAPIDVRILVPDGYTTRGPRYPVLHLYGGTGSLAEDWVDDGRADEVTAGIPLITVMPDIGFSTAVWFSDWADQTTSLGPSQWETFYIRQLVPWVDANLHTRAERSGRAVAGLSQGGFGATIAAAKHPDLFAAASSMSGATNIAYGRDVALAGHAFVTGTETSVPVPPHSIFGNPTTREINWQGNDPTTLAPNLAAVDVRLYTGNGLPGPYDTVGAGYPAAAAVEALGHYQTSSLAARGAELGLDFNLVDYGAGTHTWPYWTRDLEWFLPHMLRAFETMPNLPAEVGYLSVDRSWSQWGWSVSFDRIAEQEFSELRRASRSGFELLGTGAAVVTTPPHHRPNELVEVTVDDGTDRVSQRLRADRSGRLQIRVTLGDEPLPPAGPATIGAPSFPDTGVVVTIERAS